MQIDHGFSVPDEHVTRIAFAASHAMPEQKYKIIRLLHGGLSGACTYLVNIGDIPYAVKLERLDVKEVDLHRCCEVIETVSKQLCCPKVYFADAEQGVIVMEYIDSMPLTLHEEKCIKKFAKLVKGIHDGAPFPPWLSIFDILDYFYQKLPKEYTEMSLMKECRVEVVELAGALSNPEDIRPCHGDINPANVLFDGNRIYLVDWLTASPQNLYFDLAACAIFFYHANNDRLDLFLSEYFGRIPTNNEISKLNMMCQFSSIYYGVGFLNLSSQTNKHLPLLNAKSIDALPAYSEFMKSVGAGKIDLSNALDQQKLGYIFLLMRTKFA